MNKEIRVLLVEDDPMVQEVNRQLIEKVDGFKVIATARNGNQGIKLAKEEKPDLVLLDIYMPEQNGIDTLKQFRRSGMDIDVIIVSAANDTDTIRETLQHGAIDYIIKPFKFDRLLGALNKYRVFYRQITQNKMAEQHEVDSWLSQSSTKGFTNKVLPKGLNHQTLTQVIEFLSNEQSPMSADETAVHIGIARVTARRYLDYLGKIEKVRIKLQYGDVGRPINRYELM